MSGGAQKGFALVIALVITTALTVAALELTRESRLALRLSANYQDRTKARLAAMDGLLIAARTLLKDDPEYDGPEDAWALLTLEANPAKAKLNGFRVGIWDEAARLPLNNLAPGKSDNPEGWQDMMGRLFVLLGRDPAAVAPLLDWLDPDDDPRSGGAEIGDYPLGMKPRNGPLWDIRELELIKGFTDHLAHQTIEGVSLGQLISDHGQKGMNINTMPEILIKALAEGMGQSLVDQILDLRADEGFKALVGLKELAGMDDPLYAEITPYLDVKSTIFRVRSIGRWGRAEKALEVIFERTGGKVRVKAVVAPTPWPKVEEN